MGSYGGHLSADNKLLSGLSDNHLKTAVFWEPGG